LRGINDTKIWQFCIDNLAWKSVEGAYAKALVIMRKGEVSAALESGRLLHYSGKPAGRMPSKRRGIRPTGKSRLLFSIVKAGRMRVCAPLPSGLPNPCRSSQRSRQTQSI